MISVKLYHPISPTTVNRPVWVTSFLGLSLCWLNLSVCMCAHVVFAAAHVCVYVVEKESRREIQEILGSGPISCKDILCVLCVLCTLCVSGFQPWSGGHVERSSYSNRYSENAYHITQPTLSDSSSHSCSSYGSNHLIILDNNGTPSKMNCSCIE